MNFIAQTKKFLIEDFFRKSSYLLHKSFES